MKRAWLLLGLLALLAGCGMQTRYKVLVHAADFLPDEAKTGTLDVGSLPPGTPINQNLYIPDDDGDYSTPNMQGQRIELPAQLVESLDSAQIALELALEHTAANLEVDLELYVADEAATDVYTEGVRVGQASASPAAGEVGTLALEATVDAESPAMTYIKSGAFRVGIKLHLQGETGSDPLSITATLKKLDVAGRTVPLGDLLR